MAKIIFLGTSGDSSVTARQLRASGGIVLQIAEMQLHIDPGPGALVKAKEFGVNPRATSILLVSHNHINHANDVNAVIDAMTLGGFDKKGVLIANTTVINGNDKYLPALNLFYRFCLEKIITLMPGQKVAVDSIEILGVHASHSEENAIGFRISTPKFILGYTGDTGYNADIENSYKGCDILIINAKYPAEKSSEHHLNREDASKLIKNVKPKLAILTHFGFDMLRSDPLLEARSIQVNTGVQTIAAQDGLSISPSVYAGRK